jgi:hypothetical protein
MVKKSRMYMVAFGALAVGVVAGALVAAFTGIPAVGKLGAPGSSTEGGVAGA